ncbi:MAG: helix-turn-helix transcriptional regulator [Cellulosilyticaceae bacterium]
MLKDRLKKLRNNKQLSQRALAELIDVSQQTIGSWETGRTEPDQQAIRRLADFFNVSADYLLGNSDLPRQTRIDKAVSDDPELLEFAQELQARENMQLLFKQVKPMSDADISKIIKIIKAIEDAEDAEEGIE